MRFLGFVGVVVCASFILSCGRPPTDSGRDASLRLQVRILSPNALAKTMETAWDSLVVVIRASDMAAIRRSFVINPSVGISDQTIPSLSAGDRRIVEVWTVNRAGDTIHGVGRDTVDLEPAEVAQVSLMLTPIRGSIYVALADFPGSVDSVVAAFFTTGGQTFSVRAKKSTRSFIAIDNVPYGTSGTLLIAGLSVSRDTVASWRQDDFEFRNSNMTIEASFVSIAGVGLQVTVHEPAVTVVRGIMDTTQAVEDEMGPLVISELLFTSTVNSAPMEYVELYNPTSSTVTLDTMLLDVSGTRKILTGVVVASHEYYAIGSSAIPRDSAVWSSIDTTVSLDLVSTTGMVTVMRKDSSVIDWVGYENDANTMGWPAVSSSAKKAIVLDSLPLDPEFNNYGKNWSVATTTFAFGGFTFYGTPGR